MVSPLKKDMWDDLGQSEKESLGFMMFVSLCDDLQTLLLHFQRVTFHFTVKKLFSFQLPLSSALVLRSFRKL